MTQLHDPASSGELEVAYALGYALGATIPLLGTKPVKVLAITERSASRVI